MSNEYFQFKQFKINQSGAAMKVGTDGCLLGSWAPLEQVQTVLDIGTGTGLLALMCAQRLSALGQPFQIDAIDIEPHAVLQALENVKATLWQKQIKVICQDILRFESSVKYDLIICNPPFFFNSLKCPQKERAQARHNSSLPFLDLLRKVSDLISESGSFCVVLPMDAFEYFLQEAKLFSLFCEKCTFVKTVERKSPKRVLAQFSKRIAEREEDTLILQDEVGYTEMAKKLLKNFYLNM